MTSGNVLTLKEAKEAFKHGHNYQLQKLLGVHEMTKHNEKGFVFRVWAPKAQAVWLVGDFNQWQADLSMEKDEYGIWSIFTTLPQIGEMYKFKIKQADGREIYKIDPFAVRFEPRPHDAAYIYPTEIKKWHDGLWRGRKKRSNYFERPLNIYEVHTSSWRHHADGTPYNFTDLKDELIPYLKKMGYTHVEFMPLMEHPLPASWGYQLIGYYALSEAYGTPEEFKDFVEACHLANIGVLVDWVPGHFCVNDDALAYYDGTPTFEYNDIDQANNRGWGALNFGLDKPEVQSFLISSALYWIEEFHIDGIRVDAVSNMLYLDYDNPNWTPNEQGTNLNLAGIAFLQELNRVVKFNHPDVLMIAEESSSSTKITGLIETGALGFDYKWNMGWMNDVLNFYQMDPLYRGEHLNMLTFSFMYRLAENYILPLSHDEVVHGKKSLMHKMWGDRYKQFAQLRNLYTYLIGHPGKKLLFMGSEWGQFLEWKYYEGLEWDDLKDPLNKKMQHFTATLNELYKTERALWECDDQPETLEVIDADNQAQTVLSFIRQGKRKKDFVIVILNLSPIEYQDFQIGVPYAGEYEEILNSELSEYGGTWKQGNPNVITQSAPFKDYQYVITTTVPALGALILKPKTIKYRRKRK